MVKRRKAGAGRKKYLSKEERRSKVIQIRVSILELKRIKEIAIFRGFKKSISEFIRLQLLMELGFFEPKK